MEDIAGGAAVKKRQVVGHAAPADIGRGAVDGGQIDEQLFQSARGGGGVGKAVHTQGFGGDALPDFGVVGRFGEQFEVGVGVHINEAGADDIIGGVHGAGGVDGGAGGVGGGGDDLDGVAGDGDAGAVGGGAAAVDDGSVGE